MVSVSYTHLRTVLITIDMDDQRVVQQLEGGPGAMHAVSYTHLDVYKRQEG